MYNGFLPRQVKIDSLTSAGFRFDVMRSEKPLLALPSGMKLWEVTELSEVAFDLILAEKDDIDILIIGTGAKMRHLPLNLQTYLKSNGISFDCMASVHAIATYNILLDEKRRVAGAFLV